ncbi:MAG: hypothetical protein Fur0041_09660 [Bacteroidia bacterium]
MKRIATLSIALLAAAGLMGQDNARKPSVPHFTPLSQLQPDEYMPNTIILKVRPEFRDKCSNEFINIQAVNDFFLMLETDEVKKKFPKHKAPEKKYNQFGQEMVDLSLIYTVKYHSAMPLETAIGKLNALGYFEYVEPYFIPKAFFTPNDPSATNALSYYIYKINAASVSGTSGWDISTGSSSMVIGIVDTGTELTHADLTNQIKYNTADPLNGTDDDNDGYTDNYRGWDVAMNDNDPTWQGNAHGVHVSGCAAAQVNNNTGVAGSGFNCKFLPVKIADASGSLTASYDGIVYAADHGCKVINCSWGGSGGGSFGQQVIDYATVNMDALVVAAAGNNNLDEAFYPAAYDKVLSVAATTNTDAKAGFSNYNYTVDICAPGNNIYSTWTGNGYTNSSGTSMASPVCAGAAAIVRAYYPTYSALQAANRLKQTADNIYNAPASNAQYANKLGTGRVNLYRALTDPLAPSVDYINKTFTDNNDNVYVAGDTIRIRGDFFNYLAPTTNLTATLSVVTAGGFVTILDGTTNPGVIGTMAAVNNNADPFTVIVNPSAPINQTIMFKLTLNDGPYTTDIFFSIIVNVDYINITINDVWTTITSKGLIGYNADQQQQGLGFDYLQNGTLLYEASFMVGTSSTKVSDMARGATTPDTDFQSQMTVREIVPAVVSDFDAEGVFRDNVSPAPLPVTVRHKAYAWSNAPHRKYVIVQYTIKNTGSTALTSLYAGIFADWDVDAATYGQNRADFDAANKMGYVYYTGANGKYVGTKLLTNTAPVVSYAIDNVSGGNGGVNIFDGFATNEKYITLSTTRQQAGTTGQGNDVCNVVSAGPYSINANDSITVAFALIAGDDLTDLQNSAVDAQVMYDNNSPLNVVSVQGANNGLSVYPNPASGQTTIQFSVAEQGATDVRLYDTEGREVMLVTTGNKAQGTYYEFINTAALADGVYIVRMVNKGKVTNTKLVISH